MTQLEGGITIIESDSVRNQDWITSPATGDPESIIISNFTEFDDYIHIWTQPVTPSTRSDVKKKNFPGRIAIFTPLGTLDNVYPFQGFVDTFADRNGIKKFVHNHSILNTHKPVYLIMKYDADTYETFYDKSGNEKEYAAGWIEQMAYPFDPAPTARDFTIQGVFQIGFS